jgi:hypothetical protein
MSPYDMIELANQKIALGETLTVQARSIVVFEAREKKKKR